MKLSSNFKLRTKEQTAKLGIASMATLMLFNLGCASLPGASTPPPPPVCTPTVQARLGSSDDLLKKATEAFTSAPGLSAEQKTKLAVIYNHTYTQAVSIRMQIGELKAKLFLLVASKSYKSKEVDQLKLRIVTLDHDRLDLMFKSLADVQGIVGFGDDKEDFYRHFRDFEIQHGRDQVSI